MFSFVNVKKRARLRGWSAALVAVVALGLGAIAFVQNRSVAYELAWPGFDVPFRELASAQTILDQGYGPDSNYIHEHSWYNPMTAWLIAAATRVSGTPAPIVVSRLAPYVNLAAPAAVFLLTAVIFDGFAAVAAMAAFIFLVGTEFPFYYSATYSPWFSPESYGQAWLYLLLAALCRAFRPAASLAWSVACGALLGLTFLTHTAPALIGGAVIVLLGILEMRQLGGARESLTRVAVALGVAFVVSLPLDFEILFLYHLKVINEFPSQSPDTLLDLNELPDLVRIIALPVLVAAAGFSIRAARRLDLRMRVLLIWSAVAASLLIANFGQELLNKVGVHLPPVVPALHFFYYFMAIVSIGVGVAISEAGAAIVRQLGWGSRTGVPESRLAEGLATCALTLVLVAAAYPRYLQRSDFTELKDEAAALSQRFPADVVTWIRSHTSSDDVFLCTDDASLYIVPPAGRKVVSTNRYFSNPYVDWVARETDRARMFDQLKQHDIAGFHGLAAKYGVRYILLTRDRSSAWLRASGMRPADLPDFDAASLSGIASFELVFENDRFAILAVRPASRDPEVWAGGPASR
jgi:hypothetical protein